MKHQPHCTMATTQSTPWRTMETDACALRIKEPLLDDFIDRLFPEGGTLENAIAVRLADLLQAPGVEAKALAALFAEVTAAHPRITATTWRDLMAVRDRDPACTSYLHALLNFKGFQALAAHRIAHLLWLAGRLELASWVSNRVSLVLGPDIHPAAQLGAGIMLDHGSGIVIGETSIIEDDVSILQNVTLGGTGKDVGDRHPKVRRGVMIGAGAKILGNIEIGSYSKVAAGSVVLKNVPAGCTVAGIPAEIVRIHGTSEMPSVSMDQSV